MLCFSSRNFNKSFNHIEIRYILCCMWCSLCKKLSDDNLCLSCREALRALSWRSLYHARCPVCQQPVLDEGYHCLYCDYKLVSYGPYQGALKQLLHRYKHDGELLLSRFIASMYYELLQNHEKTLLLPIPASRKGKRMRGFDQVALICTILSFKKDIETIHLFSLNEKRMQKERSRKQRMLTDRISIKRLSITRVRTYLASGYLPVIIDDVLTTMATLQSASSHFNECFDTKPMVMVLACS